MLDSALRIGNFCWSRGSFISPARADAVVAAAVEGASLQGRFACATSGPDEGITLTRDRLGLNKLFVAVHESGRVTAASYLIDLVRRGVPLEAVYSVPAGHVVELDRHGAVVGLYPHGPRSPREYSARAAIKDLAHDIRCALEVWFSRLASQFSDRRICLCLSGGIDSSIIASLATRYFSDVVGYSYTFAAAGSAMSEDAIYASWIARSLRIPFRLVRADSEAVLLALEHAVTYGQDWRDFNVHCAIVNDILARAIRRDAASTGDKRPLVLTGDLANEFLADYTSVPFDGKEYYRLPALPPADLRRTLIRGLDVGDREVGVFSHYGLDVIQPYGFVVDQYFQIPGDALGTAHFKQTFAKQIAGDVLPGFVFDRAKVRAQMGSTAEAPGILPVLIQTGYDAARLKSVFCRIFKIRDPAALNRFVRAGRYRTINHGTGQRPVIINGYLAA